MPHAEPSAPIVLSVAELLPDFPDFRTAVVRLEGLDLARPRPAIDALVADAQRKAAARLSTEEVAAIPEIRSWRAAYRAFGVKQNRYRNALERLLRRIASGDGLPRINPLVDLYNALSVDHLMPAEADDLDRLALPLAFRRARPGDRFLDMAADPPAEEPPEPGEVVYADAEKVLCRRWNWRQDARSLIRTDTVRAVVVLQTLDPGAAGTLAAAAARLADEAARHLGATASWRIAGRGAPEVRVEP